MTISKEQLAKILSQPGYSVVTGVRSSVTDVDRSPASPTKPKRNKYNARKTAVDNIKFHSKREANRYIVLKAREQAGEISDLELQPQFLLQDGFTDDYGTKHRPIRYTADFRYTEDGIIVVEDAKGKKTVDFSIRWKWVIKQHLGSGVRFILT